MPITILAPRGTPSHHKPYAAAGVGAADSDSDSDGGADIEGDISMRPAKRSRGDNYEIVTPGEIITDDPQWMRGHGTYITQNTTDIVSSVAGTVTRTNKLLSVRPLRARYTPEIGDLVVGRIVEVQAKRWRVDVGSSQLAILQISAINLPGGILRKRTDTDELQIRSFFAEGRPSKVHVTLGVNGFIWISKHVESDAGAESVGLNRMEESVSANVYSSQNDRIDDETMREVARIRSVILALVENGLRVDEDMVVRGYKVAVDMGLESIEDDIYLGGERGKRLAEALLRE
ncbi:Exosome complex component rrp4 [Colletotrichum fioriniae]|uniref:Exosome complex component rrp4 n=1 Tax=Colletotrichum fioriniae TaxID=710243 RepID=UPI0032D9CE5F|nr:Exosome complex component rrp4 [Colletotrichum fioriniae]